MTRFEAGDIVRVPFPHVETNQRCFRPALVVTREPVGADGALIWAVMITSAERAPWPGDIAILEHRAAGLPIPSIIRTAKLATLEAPAAERIGKLPAAELACVQMQLVANLGAS